MQQLPEIAFRNPFPDSGELREEFYEQADEQSVHAEIAEYVATDSIRDQYRHLLTAIAEAPADPHESVGVWVSGFFGSGKSSFAKNLGYALQNRTVLGSKFADLFKQQLGDTRSSDLLDLINANTQPGSSFLKCRWEARRGLGLARADS